MYRRMSSILFPVALLALIAAIIWGYQEIHTKNLVLIKAENQYQRAFHDLSYHMDQLHSEIGSTIAINSSANDSYKKSLIHVWQISNQAQSEIGQLPLTMLPFSETKQLLDHISQFSYLTAIRDLKAKPITQAEMTTLNSLYGQSKTISGKLNQVQAQVLNQNLRWMDVETALASQKNDKSNEIVDGFRTVDKAVGAAQPVNWGAGIAGIMAAKQPVVIQGNPQTIKQIKRKAAQFLQVNDTSGFIVAENGKGSPNSFYSVRTKLANYKDEVQVDISKQGGQILYYMNPTIVRDKIIDRKAALEAAGDFLKQRGYGQMKAVSYDEYQNVAAIHFVKIEDNVWIYPEQLSVSVAMNNADIIGLQAASYVSGSKERKIARPALSLDQAKQVVSPKFQLKSSALAIINNDAGEEVLCYQMIGTSNGENYKIFVNALTGDEESTEVLRSQEKI